MALLQFIQPGAIGARDKGTDATQLVALADIIHCSETLVIVIMCRDEYAHPMLVERLQQRLCAHIIAVLARRKARMVPNGQHALLCMLAQIGCQPRELR